jgi:hypothetical protein
VASEFHRFRKDLGGKLADLDKEAGAIGAILEAALPEDITPDEDAKEAE